MLKFAAIFLKNRCVEHRYSMKICGFRISVTSAGVAEHLSPHVSRCTDTGILNAGKPASRETLWPREFNVEITRPECQTMAAEFDREKSLVSFALDKHRVSVSATRARTSTQTRRPRHFAIQKPRNESVRCFPARSAAASGGFSEIRNRLDVALCIPICDY